MAISRPARAQTTDSKRSPAAAVDWRGLERMDADGRSKRRDKPPPNPVQQLVQNAPYRLHVATTNGSKVTITDAYTLERRRVFVAQSIVGYSFSSDGHWLYVVHGAGKQRTVTAVAVNTAKARTITSIILRKGEHVVEVLGHGSRDAIFLTVVLGRGKPWRLALDGGDTQCGAWRKVRRVRLRERRGKLHRQDIDGAHELRFPNHKRRVSANTRYTAELAGGLAGGLTIRGRFGSSGVGKLNRKPLLSGAMGVRWMRDSRGVFVIARRRGSCRYLKGLSSFRQPPKQSASWRRQRNWRRWRLQKEVRLVRGDLAHQDLLWAPDGMRLIGVMARGVVVIEPVPRQQLHVAVIAPPSTLWPAVRPGVRTIVSGSGNLRHAEILLEQGSLDAARARLKAADSGAAGLQRLLKRLHKLRRVRARRDKEFGPFDASLDGSNADNPGLNLPNTTTATSAP